MLLAIDTGNTQTVIGLFDGTELADHWDPALALGVYTYVAVALPVVT